jgi:tetraacyldisaccharide 4'-kinase
VSILRKILYPFSFLYGKITSARNIFYDKGYLTSTSFKIPTIVVGNLSVGGTGKTPMVEYLVRLLQDKYKIAILSRGYKRSTKGFKIADLTSTPQDIGDEPMQYYTKFKEVIVAVDSDRVNGIEQITKFFLKPDVILLDDAFQHRKVAAGLNVLLTSYNNLYVDDTLLPSGNLRENKKGASRAQIIVVTKCPDALDKKEQFAITKKLNVQVHQTVFFSKIKYHNYIIGNKDNIATSILSKYHVLLVTGIAVTTPLLEFLKVNNISFEHLHYADHYDFSNKEKVKIKNEYEKIKEDKKLILTTEKDYIRSFMGIDNVYYLPIETEFIDHQHDFNKLIKKYVEQSSGNS